MVQLEGGTEETSSGDEVAGEPGGALKNIPTFLGMLEGRIWG